MSRNKIRNAAKVGDQPLSDLTLQKSKNMPAALDNETANRENPVSDDEAALLSRKRLVTAREQTVNARESASEAREHTVLVREGAAQTREEATNSREDIAARREDAMHLTQVELQSKSSEHTAMMQEANSRLVVATLAAQVQTAQIEKVSVELHHLVHHDALTNLPNRVLLKDRLSQAIEAAHRQGGQLAVMFMDIDRFKNINDSLGHAVGDQLLQSIAKRLLTSVRVSDTVSRQGGDEFVLLLPLIESPGGGRAVRQKNPGDVGATSRRWRT